MEAYFLISPQGELQEWYPLSVQRGKSQWLGRKRKMAKRIALAVGIVFGFLALFAATGSWEPHSRHVKAQELAIGALFLCFFLIWYGWPSGAGVKR